MKDSRNELARMREQELQIRLASEMLTAESTKLLGMSSIGARKRSAYPHDTYALPADPGVSSSGSRSGFTLG